MDSKTRKIINRRWRGRSWKKGGALVRRLRERSDVAEHALLDELEVGSPWEQFCACGRRWTQCDGSRSACHKRQPRSSC